VSAATGTLFVVATPIGNLGDATARSIETLRECDVILAEDTRRTRQLLSHFAIAGKRVERFDAHASTHDIQRATERLLAGERVALVTDAGTPSVSDPGEALVRAAIAAGAAVVPIPGASAVLAALVASGLGGEGFRFIGFLPRQGAARRDAIALVAATAEPVVLFESPARVAATLEDLAATTPNRAVCVARELTKAHEEFVRGSCEELARLGREWIGEVVVVLGTHNPSDREAAVGDDALDSRIDEAIARGEHAKAAAARLAAWSGRKRRDVYERLLTRKNR